MGKLRARGANPPPCVLRRTAVYLCQLLQMSSECFIPIKAAKFCVCFCNPLCNRHADRERRDENTQGSAAPHLGELEKTVALQGIAELTD